MFPLFIRFDSLVEVISPGDSLVEDLLDSKSLHFGFVLEDVVENRLADTVKVILVDFVKHGVDHVLDALFFDVVEISRDELDDVSEPVLADRCDDVHRNFTLNVLTVAGVGLASSLNASDISVLRVHNRHVFLSFVCGLNIVFSDNIELAPGVTNVLVFDNADLGVDVESFSTWSVVGSNLVADREIVFLRGARSGQSTAEGVNDGRKAADGLLRLLEALSHES
jgi:hypothetical protein